MCFMVSDKLRPMYVLLFMLCTKLQYCTCCNFVYNILYMLQHLSYNHTSCNMYMILCTCSQIVVGKETFCSIFTFNFLAWGLRGRWCGGPWRIQVCAVVSSESPAFLFPPFFTLILEFLRPPTLFGCIFLPLLSLKYTTPRWNPRTDTKY